MDNSERSTRPAARACSHVLEHADPIDMSHQPILDRRLIYRLPHHLAALLLCACACAGSPTRADSLASSASSAGSAASGSVSDSLHGSSNSSADSSRDARQVANGDYRILALVPTPERPGKLRLTLRWEAPLAQAEALAPGEATSLMLDLPIEVVREQGLGTGGTVHAERRVYGIEFSRADNRHPFFLVLADDWHDDLTARRVIGL